MKSLKKTAGTSEAEEADSKKNQGQLIVDASCVPADIRYPTDISLMNEARENAEGFIDYLYENYRQLLKRSPVIIDRSHEENIYHLLKKDDREQRLGERP